MWNHKILHLLSQHRQLSQPAFPEVLSFTQITSLLRQCLDPNQTTDQIGTEVQSALQELEAQDEVVRAPGNRYCMAPPTLLAINQESLIGLRFRGDRAYLSLAHEILKTNQLPTEERLRSNLKNFGRAKIRLQEYQIRLLTLEEMISELPKPQKPQRFQLAEHQASLEIAELWKMSGVQQYVPTYAEQQDRWCKPASTTLVSESLLKIAENQYLWFEEDAFYEIETDTAILAMFYLDQRDQQSIRLVLEDTGNLNLQNVLLPYVYFQWFKQFAEQCEGKRRIYYIPPAYRPFVKAFFQYLGCDLR